MNDRDSRTKVDPERPWAPKHQRPDHDLDEAMKRGSQMFRSPADRSNDDRRHRMKPPTRRFGVKPTSSYDPQPGDVRVTVATALILLALLVLMTVL
jgi:hypothetical protein